MDSEMRGRLPKHDDRGKRGVESVGRLWRRKEEETCGAAFLPRLPRADQDFHDRHGSTRVFCFLCLRRQSGFFFPASDTRFFVLHCVS